MGDCDMYFQIETTRFTRTRHLPRMPQLQEPDRVQTTAAGLLAYLLV